MLSATPQSWPRSATGTSRAIWAAAPGGALSARPSRRAGRWQWRAIALVARLLLPAQPMAGQLLPYWPVLLFAWHTLRSWHTLHCWRTLMAKTGMAESLARLGVSALQRL